jgi:hypothetical protein
VSLKSIDKRALLLPALLFAIAFGFRLIGIGWGLPNDLHNQSYHPDEQVIWNYSQAVEPARLDLTPGFYNYGTLYLTTLKVASDMVAAYGGGARPNDPQSVWEYIGRCHLAGRVISALAGAGSALVLFFLLRRLTNPLGASLGALFLAFAPAYVVHSRFQTVDVLATFLLIASAFYAVRLLTSESGDRVLRDAVLSGLFAGLSAATKYTGILAILMLFAALWLRGKREEGPKWQAKAAGYGVLAALGAFVIGTPGVLLETGKFIEDFKYEMVHTSTGHGIHFEGVPYGFLYHLKNLGEGLGPLMFLSSIAALVYAAYRRHAWAFVLLAFFIPYFILIGRAEVLFLRYTFPLYLALAVSFGWLAGRAHEKKGSYSAVVVLCILALGGGFGISAMMTGGMAGEDPRDATARYFKALAQNEPISVGLVSDPWYYTPPLIPNSTLMRGRYSILLDEMRASEKPQVLQYVPKNPNERFDWDVRLLTELRPDYVVFSNFEVGDVARLTTATNASELAKLQVARFQEFHTRLEEEFEQITPPARGATLAERYRDASLLAHDMAYIRPILWIWKRKTQP